MATWDPSVPAWHTLEHTPRPIRFLDLWTMDGWRVKCYGICERAEAPDPPLIEVAKELARDVLPQPAQTPDRYGVAFVTIHQAAMFNQIVVDWWARVNELRHHVFKALPDDPTDFYDITETGEAFCVWELRVIGFERQAWLDHVLVNPDGADLPRYLGAHLNEDA